MHQQTGQQAIRHAHCRSAECSWPVCLPSHPAASIPTHGNQLTNSAHFMLAKSLAFFSFTTSKRSGATSKASALSSTVYRVHRCIQPSTQLRSVGVPSRCMGHHSRKHQGCFAIRMCTAWRHSGRADTSAQQRQWRWQQQRCSSNVCTVQACPPHLRQRGQCVGVAIHSDEQAGHRGAHAIVQARQLSGVGDLCDEGRSSSSSSRRGSCEPSSTYAAASPDSMASKRQNG